MSCEKIIRMANQIATFMMTKPDDEGALGCASHINDFWAPSMRQQLFEALDAKDKRLLPLVQRAASHIKRPASNHKTS